MNFSFLLVLVALYSQPISGKEDSPKVQIGIKKRVENCSQKTRKGDFVHVHYSVNLINFAIGNILLIHILSVRRVRCKMAQNLIAVTHAERRLHLHLAQIK